MKKKVLNKKQKKAVQFGKGPLLIIAGAGTGKTTVITERIKYLISSKKVKPSHILALTFTEKSALEMEERVDKIVPFGYTQMFVSTFHSFCDYILKDEALHIGLNSHFILMTQAESLIFLRERLFDLNLDYFRPTGNPEKFLEGMLRHFDRLRDEDISPDQYLSWAESQASKTKAETEEQKKNIELARAFKKYQQFKFKEGVMDFSDLITQTLGLFRKRKNILKKYRKKFQYLLVDEYQDTNISQNKLVSLLAGEKGNLTCVADDDQSIYRFRGSSVSNVLQFKKDYPQAQIITLTKNYRSTQEILNRAYDLIQHNNPDRLEVKEKINKKLVSARKLKGDKIKFIFADRAENEAEEVVKKIIQLVKDKKNKYKWKDCAVLVRANNHAHGFVQAFLRNGVPFQFLGPGRLFKQEEIKDLIAYLKVLYNFENNVAFFRVLSMSLFEISGRDIAVIRNLAKKENISMFEAAERVEELNISSKGSKKIKNIVEMVHRHLDLINKETAGQILYYFLEDTKLLQKMADFKTEKEEQQANNIAKFFDKLKCYEVDHQEAGVEKVVSWINLKLEMGESPLASDTDWREENKVNILTVHSAKGLEFPIVFLVNLVNARFPTRRRGEQIPIPEDLIKEILPEGDFHLQEERRLFYVGMTRAKDRLFFSSAKYYGEGKRMKKISPFVYQALGDQLQKQTLKPSENQLSIFEFSSPSVTPQPSTIFRQPPITYLSYSQVGTFKRCPLQYKYKYILKIPTPLSSSASFGISIHQALKDFYDLLKERKKADKKKLLKILDDCWIKEGYSSSKHQQKMYRKAQQFLKKYYQKNFPKRISVVGLEQSFTARIDKNLKIGGRFDRVDKIEKGIEIIDYKTGKIKTQKEVDKSLQMTFYALGAVDRGVYNKTPENIKLSFYFLKEQKKVSTKRTKQELQKAEKEIVGTAEQIEKSDFLPKPSPLCDFCDYKLLCPAWQ